MLLTNTRLAILIFALARRFISLNALLGNSLLKLFVVAASKLVDIVTYDEDHVLG